MWRWGGSNGPLRLPAVPRVDEAEGVAAPSRFHFCVFPTHRNESNQSGVAVFGPGLGLGAGVRKVLGPNKIFGQRFSYNESGNTPTVVSAHNAALSSHGTGLEITCRRRFGRKTTGCLKTEKLRSSNAYKLLKIPLLEPKTKPEYLS